METKCCTKCGETKPLDEYHREGRSRDGRRSRCKLCVNAGRAEYNARPDVKARKSEYMAGYYTANREAVLASRAEHYQSNRDAILARNAEYYARPEVKERHAEYCAAYRAAKPHMGWEAGYRERASAYGFEPRVESFTREALIEKWGDACVYCGGPFEELDHHIPVAHGGPHTIENARPSCTPCNRRGAAVRTTNKPEEVTA